MLEIQDHYFHLAKKDGYVARSAYKLQEIDEKYKLFWFNSRRESWPIVIDIGCAPGSWLQYTSKKIAKGGRKKVAKHLSLWSDIDSSSVWDDERSQWKRPLIIGFDLKKVKLNLPHTHTFVQDITEQDKVMKIINEHLAISNEWSPKNQELGTNNHKVDVIISDMAPDTVWDKATDALRSCSLIMETMRMYEMLLKPDGKFTIKVFMWPWFEDLVQYCRTRRWAAHIKIFKPKACRKESKETYIVKI